MYSKCGLNPESHRDCDVGKLRARGGRKTGCEDHLSATPPTTHVAVCIVIRPRAVAQPSGLQHNYDNNDMRMANCFTP